MMMEMVRLNALSNPLVFSPSSSVAGYSNAIGSEQNWRPEADWARLLQAKSNRCQEQWTAASQSLTTDFSPMNVLCAQSHLYQAVLQVELSSKLLTSASQTINRLVNLA